MIRMRILKSCMLVIAALTVASGLMGCNQKSNTLDTVTVTPANQSMARGTTMLFTANGTFTNGMILNWTQVVQWSSSSPSVADVSNAAGLNGIVTSKTTTGTTILTAFDVANNITGTALVTVADPDPVLTILPTGPYMPVGTTYPFSAIASFALVSGGTVTQAITLFASWSSSNTAVAAVGNGIITAGSITGMVTALTTGTTIIQATEPNSGATGTTLVTVTSGPFILIAVGPVNPIISNGTTTQFTAIGSFADGSTTKTLNPNVDASWHWTSSNTWIATIDFYTGLATAVYPGSTLITAIDPITGAAGNTTLYVQ
jgi:hypothetical protein